MSNNFNPQKVAHFKSKFKKASNTTQPPQPAQPPQRGQTAQPPMAPAQPAQPHAATAPPARQHQPQARPAQSAQPDQPQAQPAPVQSAQPATTSASGATPTRILIGVSALVLVAALAVGGTYLFMRNDNATVSSPEPVAEDQQDSEPDQSGIGGDEEEPAVSDGAEGSDTSDDSSLSSAEKLDQKVEEDKVVVDQNLLGKWVPQISSKKVGMEADGQVWDEDAIYDEHQELANEYGVSQVLLLKSEDYASYRQPGFYVTVIDSSYEDPDDALQWCRFHSLDADHCYAKQINTTGGPDGTTRLQE